MENQIELFMKKIFEKYCELKIPNRYTLDEADSTLKEKYLAYEEDINRADAETENLAAVRKYYVIENPLVLQRIFTDTEKIDLYNMIQLLKEELYDFQNELEKMWNGIQTGQRINIILESENLKHISGFTLQGISEKLFNELCIFEGIDSMKCHLGNEEFHEYLKRLVRAGFIKF
ncbi:hypothetical protein CVD28_12570 [Bacillus sp. M6-12]|uniref:hypothetical protein n=1 Tax=Bacillus sp. M6-12 TaxID=2054166 RepID=UPI000C78DD21|nr:hypothetical protein [Bacillus sp. M6-12]PLS17389.1 hypothetical protein CVD28_12570 [Bacillus sp. M6-12]